MEEVYGRKMSERRENLPILGKIATWYQYHVGVVPVALRQRQNGTGTNQNGTSTTHQNRVGTDIDSSGTSTNASNSSDICVLALLSPNSYTDGI